MRDAIEPFQPPVSDAELDDLRRRLRATRWPEAETDRGQGVALRELQALCAYWADGYDWRALERRLNAVPQCRTVIDGLGIHFLHARRQRGGDRSRTREPAGVRRPRVRQGAAPAPALPHGLPL